jgi:hypothetical protein
MVFSAPAALAIDRTKRNIISSSSTLKESEHSTMSAIECKVKDGVAFDGDDWSIEASEMALRTSNPIRKIVDALNVTSTSSK